VAPRHHGKTLVRTFGGLLGRGNPGSPGSWRVLAVAGGDVSLFLMVGFFGPTKLLRIAADFAVLWAALINWALVALAH
ncbi:MAG TPA: hypothetical protein VET26_06775, partial [Candidatus Sulfotelmatobacter sp.]|nr:hypothetical protein [Candidatus Sulfotelmatobacter sp.]